MVKLVPAGAALDRWLAANGKSKDWLVAEMNSWRAREGISGQVGRGAIWRWMTGNVRINIDDAVLIQLITEEGTWEPVDARLWSRHWRARPPLPTVKATTPSKKRKAA